jgi:hypothetical protein
MAMKDGTCSECGSPKIYSAEGGLTFANAGPGLVSSTTMKLRTYLCIACGHVTLAAPAETLHELELLATLVEQGGWAPVNES